MLRPHTAAIIVLSSALVSLCVAPQLHPQTPVAASGGRHALGLAVAAAVGLLLSALASHLLRRSAPKRRERSLIAAAVVSSPLLVLWTSEAPRQTVIATVAAVALLAVVLGTGASRRRTAAILVAAGITLAAGMAVPPNPSGTWLLVLGCAWAAILVIALGGWGCVVESLLDLPEPFGPGLRAALGLALTVAVGGVLEISRGISRFTVLLWVAAGVGAVVARRRPTLGTPRLRADPLVAAAGIALAGVLVLQVAASITGTVDTVHTTPSFDHHDDRQAYLAFPRKMLATGALGSEPFEPRRMLSLGGQPFLQTLVVAALPLRSLHLLDAGVAMVILVGLVVGWVRRHRIDPRLGLLAVAVTLALPHVQHRGNTSALLTGAVFLLAWYRLLADGIGPPAAPRTAAAVALIAAALCAVKSTFVPAAAAMLATMLAIALARRHRRLAAESVLAAVGTGLLLLPWMTSSLASSGTAFYPILGRGFFGGVWTDGFAHMTGEFGSSAVEAVQAIVKLLVAMLPVAVLWMATRSTNRRHAELVLAAGALATVVALVVLGEPSLNRALARYSFPVVSAVLVGFLLAAIRADRGGGGSLRLASVAAVSVSALVLVGGADDVRTTADRLTAQLARPQPIVDEAARKSVADLESALPKNGALLATLRDPWLLDPAARTVYLMSLPGQSSPPPGLPVFEGAEAVARYLENAGVTHVAYGGVGDLRRLLDLSERQILERYPRVKMRWVILRYHQRYQAVIRRLMQSRKRLYDDPPRVLLDLGRRVGTIVPAESPEQVRGFVGEEWTGREAILESPPCPHGTRYLKVSTHGWRPRGCEVGATEVTVAADGRPLQLEQHGENELLFSFDSPVDQVDELRISAPVFRPGEIGAAIGPAVGLDIASVELAATSSDLAPPTRRTIQTVRGPLAPQRVWDRSGFHADFNWTDGDASLSGLRWPVPASAATFVVHLSPVHPRRESIDLEVAVNGLDLELIGTDGWTWRYAIYDGLEAIEAIRLRSSTFVPRRVTGAPDDRRLGVPVLRLEID